MVSSDPLQNICFSHMESSDIINFELGFIKHCKNDILTTFQTEYIIVAMSRIGDQAVAYGVTNPGPC